jgi:DNA-binding PadR family transcriptional regulator
MRGRMRFMPNHPGGHRGDRGEHGPHRQRARRGAVRGAILRLLADHPMHGYELIGELEQRTGGRWRPSPGSVYPTLAQLEDEGLVRAIVGDADDKKRYELTDTGRTWLEEHPEESFGRAWPGESEGPDVGRQFGFGGPGGFGGRGEMRRLGGEIFGQLRQLGQFGTPAQQEQAKAILARTRTDLYAVLAQPPVDEAAAPGAPEASEGPADTEA